MDPPGITQGVEERTSQVLGLHGWLQAPFSPLRRPEHL